MLLIGFSGVLKALELENQVLKLRNAQLELAGNTETLKGWFDVFVINFRFESVTVMHLQWNQYIYLPLITSHRLYWCSQ